MGWVLDKFGEGVNMIKNHDTKSLLIKRFYWRLESSRAKCWSKNVARGGSRDNTWEAGM